MSSTRAHISHAKDAYFFLAVNQRVADFLEQDFGGRSWRRRGWLLGLFQPVRNLDKLEENEGNDQELDQDSDEAAIGEGGALGLCRLKGEAP